MKIDRTQKAEPQAVRDFGSWVSRGHDVGPGSHLQHEADGRSWPASVDQNEENGKDRHGRGCGVWSFGVNQGRQSGDSWLTGVLAYGRISEAAENTSDGNSAFATPTGRLESIDFLRGCAAMGVLLLHAALSGIIPNPPLWFRILYGTMLQGWWGVPLFYVISGFCIHLRWAKPQARN